MIRIILLIAIIPIFSNLSIAQYGFVRGAYINHQGDSIKGKLQYLKNRANQKGVNFIGDDGVSNYLTPENAKRIYFGSFEILEAMSLEEGGGSTFVRWEIKGFISLYFSSNDVPYLIIPDGRHLKLSNRSQLQSLMQDNIMILMKIKDMGFTNPEIINIIKSYNFDALSLEWSRKDVPQKWKMEPGIYLGGGMGMSGFMSDYHFIGSSFTNSTDPFLGGGITFNVLRPRSSHLSPVTLSLGYQSRSAYFFAHNSEEDKYLDYFVEFSSLNLELGQRQIGNLLQFEYGISALINFDSNSYFSEETIVNNVVTSREIENSFPGFGLGTRIAIGKSISFGGFKGISTWISAGIISDVKSYMIYQGEFRLSYELIHLFEKN